MKDIFLLDMDDTLLDFGRAERENFFKTLSDEGVPPSDALYARFHIINEGLWKLLEKGGILREELKVKRFADLFAEHGLEADAVKAADAYWNNFPAIFYPFAGALEFLKELAAAGSVYIATNGGAAIQRAHIQRAGFSPYIKGAFISEEVGADKPSKRFSDYMISHIEGFDRSRAVWIGDSLSSDMVCAKNAGIDFILYLPRKKETDYAGLKASSFSEVLALIGRL